MLLGHETNSWSVGLQYLPGWPDRRDISAIARVAMLGYEALTVQIRRDAIHPNLSLTSMMFGKPCQDENTFATAAVLIASNQTRKKRLDQDENLGGSAGPHLRECES